jgi:hypothetical protein
LRGSINEDAVMSGLWDWIKEPTLPGLWKWVVWYLVLVTVVRAVLIGRNNLTNYRSALASFLDRWQLSEVGAGTRTDSGAISNGQPSTAVPVLVGSVSDTPLVGSPTPGASQAATPPPGTAPMTEVRVEAEAAAKEEPPKRNPVKWLIAWLGKLRSKVCRCPKVDDDADGARVVPGIGGERVVLSRATLRQLQVGRRAGWWESIFFAGTRLSARWALLHAVENNLIATSNTARTKLIVEIERDRLLGDLAGRSEPAAVVHRAALAKPLDKSVVAAAKRYADGYTDDAYEQAGRVHQMAYFMAVALGCVLVLVGNHLARGESDAAVPTVVALGALGGVLSFTMRLLRSGEGVGGDNGLQWSRLLLAPIIGGASAIVGLLVIGLLVANGVAGAKLGAVCEELRFRNAATDCPTTTTMTTTATTTIAKSTSADVGISGDSPAAANAGGSTGSTTTTSPPTTAVAPATAIIAAVTTTTAPNATDGTGSKPKELSISVMTAGLAVMLGFSERFFQRWIERAEEGFNPGGVLGGPSVAATTDAATTEQTTGVVRVTVPGAHAEAAATTIDVSGTASAVLTINGIDITINPAAT